MRNLLTAVVMIVLSAGVTLPCNAQTNAELFNYFQQYAGMTQDQLKAIRGGQAVAVNSKSRIPDEIFVLGAVYVNAAPESYVKMAYDFNRLRGIPGYLAIDKFSDPPQLSDLKGFAYDSKDIEDLQNCKPEHCNIQAPDSTINLRSTINWSAPDVDQQVNQLAQKLMLQRVLAYQKGGNQALGEYNDKKNPTQVAEQFKYMLSYNQVLPKALPGFYNYLLEYPNGKPANVENMFYWANVKFGLKPTLRVVQVVTMKGDNPHEPAYAIAEKQLYSSHYFETALDLTYCFRSDDPKLPGFYLVMLMGSEQAGLTGFKGTIVRKAAVSRSATSLQKTLASIKTTLESNH